MSTKRRIDHTKNISSEKPLRGFVNVIPGDLITFKYRENVWYSEDMIILQSEHDKIQNLDKHYSLEFHLPLFALFR